jgi:hypothetical protein
MSRIVGSVYKSDLGASDPDEINKYVKRYNETNDINETDKDKGVNVLVFDATRVFHAGTEGASGEVRCSAYIRKSEAQVATSRVDLSKGAGLSDAPTAPDASHKSSWMKKIPSLSGFVSLSSYLIRPKKISKRLG